MAEMSQFIPEANVEADATTLVPDFRNGDEILLDEIEKLMEAGTDNQRRILANVDRFKQVHFYEQPAKPSSSFGSTSHYLDTKNRLYTSTSGLVEPTSCKVGVWAHLRNYEAVNGYEAITAPSPVFIERAIYDVEAGEYQPESYGYKSPFDELQGIQR
jgi:hypothetical protein